MTNTFSISGPGRQQVGTSGTVDFPFTVLRTGDLSAAGAVDYYQAYGGTADSSDFAGPTAGTVSFAPGQQAATIHIAVAGDSNPEPDETFTLALGNGRGGVIDPSAGSATATIASTAGTSPQRVTLADGGYVVFQASGSGELAQKYDAHGAAVGSPVQVYEAPDNVLPLSDGGYVVVKHYGAAGEIRAISTANVQDNYLPSLGGPIVAASPKGGFIVGSQALLDGTQPFSSPPPTGIRLYTNAGRQIDGGGIYEDGPLPSVTVNADGQYVITRDGFQPLVIDPTEGASAFHYPPPLPGGITGIDDTGSTPQTFSSGATIGDTTPTFHIPVSTTGDIKITGFGDSQAKTFVHVTAADVAAGYVEVTPTLGPWHRTIYFTPFGNDGLEGPSSSFDLTLVGTLSISAPAAHVEGGDGQVTDFTFTVTRSNSSFGAADVDFFRSYGGTADDSDFAGPTAGTIHFDWYQTTATIHISVAGDTAAEPDDSFIITLGNARGAVIDSSHGSATATIINDDSAVPPDQTTFTLTGSSPQTVTGNNAGDTFYSNNNGNTLFGGTGDDTFYLGRNGDQATGGGGNDTFVFNENPWSAYGHITDFNAGDRLDLTPTLQKAGWTSGHDALAEGYLKFDSDASGAARVWFDPAPTGGGDWWLVTTLDGVSASSLHASGGVITV